MTSWNQAVVVFRKEIKDAFRDRRAIASILFGAIVGPIMVGFMLNRLAERQRQVLEITIPVVGMEYAPALIDWLRQQAGVDVVQGPVDPEASVRNGAEHVIVVIPSDFQKRFRSSSPVDVRSRVGRLANDFAAVHVRVRRLLERYNGEIGTLRLVGRGVSPAIASPLRLEELEVSSAQQRAARILGFIPLFIVLAAFTAGMQMRLIPRLASVNAVRSNRSSSTRRPGGRSSQEGGSAATVAAMLGVLLTTALVPACFDTFRCTNWRSISPWAGADCRAAGCGAAYVPAVHGHPDLPRHLRAIVQGSADLHGNADPVPDDSRNRRLCLFARHAGVDVSHSSAGSTRITAADALGAKPTPVWAFVSAGAGAFACSVLLLQLTTRLLQRERIIFSR